MNSDGIRGRQHHGVYRSRNNADIPDRLVFSKLPGYSKGSVAFVPDTARAPRGRYNRGDWDYERGYFTQVSMDGKNLLMTASAH